MLAVLSSLGLFTLWSVFGVATLSALGLDLRDGRIALTAPIVGTAVTAIPLFVVSNAGVSMDAGARVVLALLAVLSVGILALRLPRLPLSVVPVVLLAVAGLCFVGRPLFTFGFDWLANANGDMAFYVLSATHLMRHGLQSPVDFAALAASRDYPTESQELTLRGLRPGAPIVLAGLASATSRSPVSLYMPMSLAIQMGTVCATAAFALRSSYRWWVGAVAAALLAVSPMAGYGVLQQLLPQNWGLGLVAALFAWLLRPSVHGEERRPYAEIAVIAILTAALFAIAFEVASSFLLAYGIYVVVLLVRRRVRIRSVAVLWAAPVALTMLTVNTYLPKAVHYLTHYVFGFATSGGFTGLYQFGYAVVPTAVPGAAGMRSLFDPPQTPHMTIFFVLALLFFVCLVAATAYAIYKDTAVGLTMGSLFLLGLLLARDGNDFGLFKLYMYGQPFVAATIAVAVGSMARRVTRNAALLLVAALVALQVPTLARYVHRSYSPVDLRHASEADLLPRFGSILADARGPVVTVGDNFALQQLQGAAADQRQVFFISRNLFGQPWTTRRFAIPGSTRPRADVFLQNTSASGALRAPGCSLVIPSGSQIALNRRQLPEGSPNLLRIGCREPRNLLAFASSALGQPATLPESRRAVSFWQLEPDPSFPGRTFSGFGRYALLEVFGPRRELRVSLDLTTSPTSPPSRSYALPPASVIGERRAPFPVLGAGSAHAVSEPVTPRTIGGRQYLLLDMGRPGRFPVVPRPGAGGLWGRSILLDPRLLTSYVRDVSTLSAEEEATAAAPTSIASIPTDLAQPGLEYSGLFEDGWVARRAYARLAGAGAHLTLRANIASRPAGQHLAVVVDGRTYWSKDVGAGPVTVRVAVPPKKSARVVELRFAGIVRLTAPDTRSVSAQVTYLGFGR